MKKLAILVVCRAEAEAMKHQEDVAVISIWSPGASPADIRHPRPDRVLSISFPDIRDTTLAEKMEEGRKAAGLPPMAFSEAHAKTILDFVDKMLAAGVTHFVAHCDAGISRSTGVACALNRIYNNHMEIPYRYQYYNPIVVDKILKFKGKGIYDGETYEAI